MIIDTNSKNIFASNNGGKGRVDNNNTQPNAAEPKPLGAAKPEVSLSSQAQRLSQLESSIQAAPATNEQRVAEIKLAIANGTFEINAERIASRMLEQDRLF
jgi:negative regulator of flagellin synthesis FlgM